MAVPILAGGLVVGVSKKAENKRKQASANVFSNKYPLLDDCTSMDVFLKNAMFELKQIESSPANTAATKRIKRRNADSLRSWISVIKGHLKDLTCGINVASTESVPQVVMPSSKREGQLEQQELSRSPKTQSNVINSITEDQSSNEEKSDDSDNGKNKNLLLIGAVAIGVIIIFKFMKK